MITAIPLEPVPSQTLTIRLGGQAVRVNVYTRTFGLFVDIYVENRLVIGGVRALNMTKIVRSAYLGFVGDIFFFDTKDTQDPDYLGLGTRFVLLYDDAL